ncbi:uncharacterized protein BJ212DRAFT_1301019 [Suillus subaureus]|uniref:DDE-1 domain-containing protein n=1 Tax=Suillus subaureus TaxID=48587 RepID=A0A9P7E7P4_9AGAM|nr:uncharacterized protein BJ212DRAFT_1301019 [Suillus subaureus]KAG1813639.1 hypothetical protein BJ212DRAFT_1301019 [Suillus subaureus]
MSTGFSPFQLHLGCSPCMLPPIVADPQLVDEPEDQRVRTTLSRLEQDIMEAQDNLLVAKAVQATNTRSLTNARLADENNIWFDGSDLARKMMNGYHRGSWRIAKPWMFGRKNGLKDSGKGSQCILAHILSSYHLVNHTLFHIIDSGSDCGYLGGVNADYSGSDLEYEPDTSESEWSDDESLCEFGGDDLEENLAALRAKAESLHDHPMAVPMFEKKTAVEWEKAEWNRALAYNGHSESDGDDSDGDSSGLAACQNDQPAVPPLKWCKLDVPYHEQRRLVKETRLEEMKKALASIEKLLKVKKASFVGGPNGLQAKHARSIQSYLTMVIKKKCLSIDVSQRAAESHGFAANWGGHQVCSWTRLWVADHRLPESLQGQHAKVYSLLGDPTIATELRTYVHSNKWVINPEKFIQLSQDRLIPAEATKYAQKLVEEEMPHGLKKLVQFTVGDVDTEVPANPSNYVECHLVLCTHDKMTAQGNDAVGQYWVFDDEFHLWKKRAGQGLHQSDVISSMVSHLVEAGETMEYGKNHEGYWCGENFCTQLTEKIIPTFERARCPRYQALFLIDNSQGHSAYAEDALLVSCMNIHPGWKQANMQNGWFIQDGI